MTPLRKTLAAVAIALTAAAIATTGFTTPAQADPGRRAHAHGPVARHGLAHQAPRRGLRRHYRRQVFRPGLRLGYGFRHGRRVVIINRGRGVGPYAYYPYAGRHVQYGLFGGLLGGVFGVPTIGHRLR